MAHFSLQLEAAQDEGALHEVAALARAIWQEHFPGIIGQAQVDYMLLQGYSLPAMRAEMAAGVRYTIARLQGRPIGYTAHGPGDADALWLHKLYVAAEHRRRGLARTLLGDAQAHARQRGCGIIRLRVNRHNRVAVGFYRRVGFRIEAADVKDIGGGFVMDDYLMRRAVTSRVSGVADARP